MATSVPDPLSLSSMRRRLIAAPTNDTTAGLDARSDTVDFDVPDGNGLLQDELQQDASAPVRGSHAEVEAVLERYQAEKGGAALPELELRPPTNSVSANGLRRATTPAPPVAASGNFHGEVLRGVGSRNGLPALTGNSYNELEKLRAENVELRAVVAELRQFLEENDPTAWEQKVQESTAAVAERDELIEAQRKHIDEWQAKLKSHRFVPSDDDLAEMSDELEKERCQLAQEKKELDAERQQLREDEDALMRQMREMEVSMARDRAELARQRTELQRLQIEIKHELELMQRGDASVKDRLAAFQRRTQELGARPTQTPTAPLPTPIAAPMAAPPSKARDSGVFKRLFGQGNG